MAGSRRSASAPPKACDGSWSRRAQLAEISALADYRTKAPYAREAHPTDEHFLPIHVAFGAAGKGAHGRALHRSFTLGNLSMASYAFD